MLIVVAAIIRQNGRILITQRSANTHLAQLWEFPGGKVEPGETHQDALRREIREEIGLEIDIHGLVFEVAHDYPGRSVRLHFYDCSVITGMPQRLQVSDLRWVYPSELEAAEFPAADQELIAILKTAE